MPPLDTAVQPNDCLAYCCPSLGASGKLTLAVLLVTSVLLETSVSKSDIVEAVCVPVWLALSVASTLGTLPKPTCVALTLCGLSEGNASCLVSFKYCV